MSHSHHNHRPDIEGGVITAMAAATKTPFKTAFMAAFGLGVARLALFLTFVLGCTIIYGISTLF